MSVRIKELQRPKGRSARSDFGRIVEECRPKLMLMARMGTAERRLWLKRDALLADVVAFGLEVADRIGADR